MRNLGRFVDPLWKWSVRIAGLFLILQQGSSHEPAEKPVLYVAALAMMGVTVTIPADLKRRERRRTSNDDDDDE